MKTLLPTRRWGLLAGLLLGLLSTGQAWAQPTIRFDKLTLMPRQEAYVPLNGGTVVSLVQTNDSVSAGLPIGFEFKFEGNSYNTAYASSNGFLSFNSLLSSTRDNDFDNLSGDSQPLLAALWDDLDGSNGTASYRTTGAVGSRVFTFEWRNWKWGVTATAPNISFQVRLYEGAGRVEYAYNNVGSAPVTGDGASIGLITDWAFLSLRDTGTAPSYSKATATNNLTTPPASGQVYAFVPPMAPSNDECSGAVALTVAPANNPCANAYNAINANATASSSSLQVCDGGKDTWYSFVAPASGTIHVETTANDDRLEVFSGSCGSLTSVNCVDYSKQVSGLTAGTTYYLRVVLQNFGSDDPYSICVSNLEAAPLLTNDLCSTATVLTVGSNGSCNSVNGTLEGATKDFPGPSCATFWVQRSWYDVWYQFVVPANGAAVVRTSAGTAVNALNDVTLALYSGTCGTLTELGCNRFNGNDNFGTVGVSGRTPGEVLYARVFHDSEGTFGICVNDGTPGDLVVNTLNRDINGTYRNVTITGTGVARLTNNLTVTNALTLQTGGELNLDTRTVSGPGSFTTQAGSTLQLRNAGGLSASGTTGAVQVTGTRSFSDDASYTYRVSASYVSGTGLPATVRELFVNTDIDFNTDGGTPPTAGELTLSSPLSVRRRLRLRRDLVTSNTNLLTLLSNPTQGSALVFNEPEGGPLGGTPGVVAGPARVQRAIDPSVNPGTGYRHYSAPVTGSTVADLATGGFAPVVNPAYNAAAEPNLVTPFPTVFGYDESRVATVTSSYGAFDKGWVSPASTGAALAVGRGYTVNIGAGALVDFEGTPVTGDQTVSLSRGASADGGWHLVGNPYPSPIDWSQASIPSGMSAAAYVYESTGQYAGQYRTYVNGIGNPIIPSGQGFFVRNVGAAGSSVDFTFDNFMRETTFSTGTNFRRGSAERRPLVKLSLQGSAAALADETTVYFDLAATAAADARTDATKLRNPGGQAPNLFSLAGATELAINGLGLPTGSAAITVPLGLNVPTAGTYTIAAEQLLNLAPAGLSNVVLVDRRTNQQTALSRMGASYTFQLGVTELTSVGRFALVFNPSAAPLATASTLAQQLSVYPNPAHGRFTLSVPALPGTPALQATLLNGLGQVVQPARRLTLSASGAVAEFATDKLAAGVYLLQLRSEGIAPVTKRVVVE
ncbi:T9SS type A sorting domain-containing protein [Hymenobacter sp. ASUV-10]|uniref:T9SS type A sorting domain-containing protein n=1 Tax=Hymenobacter aranciens TaxID=3063996 RepID=A0ABT9B9C9_9BACT|nr:T9SS type A sorting domain-containing protein [Hymenobacter sp. ASUV-10]MDO7874882.1 T9SS type A sorting domain-containing protein [Hymenobacter sp. ASUV-10]